MRDTRAAHSGNRIETFLQIAVERDNLRILVPRLPRVAETGIAVDGRLVAFAVVVSTLTGIAFGLAPALHASSTNLVESLDFSAHSGRLLSD